MKLRCTKRLSSSLETAALTGFAPTLAAFNESATSNCAREARKKFCSYPGNNACNGFREGTKWPFLAWPLWAAHTRAIKEVSCWDASIPASCLQASALCSFATAMAGALPAAGRAPLPLRVFWSQFSSSQLSHSQAQTAAASVPLLLLPAVPTDCGLFFLEIVGNWSAGGFWSRRTGRDSALGCWNIPTGHGRNSITFFL